jgi:hypothetical protein
MRPKTRRIARDAHIANNQFFVRVLAVQIRFEMRKIEHALAQSISENDDAFALLYG